MKWQLKKRNGFPPTKWKCDFCMRINRLHHHHTSSHPHVFGQTTNENSLKSFSIVVCFRFVCHSKSITINENLLDSMHGSGRMNGVILTSFRSAIFVVFFYELLCIENVFLLSLMVWSFMWISFPPSRAPQISRSFSDPLLGIVSHSLAHRLSSIYVPSLDQNGGLCYIASDKIPSMIYGMIHF